MDWWEEQQAAIVRDPSHIPASLAPMALLPDYAAQYLASISDTLSEFYLCRKYDPHDVCLVASARSPGKSSFDQMLWPARGVGKYFSRVLCCPVGGI